MIRVLSLSIVLGAIVVGAKANRFAVLQSNQVAFLSRRVLQRRKGAIVEDIAVLVNLNESRTFMCGRGPEDLGEMFSV